MSGDFDDMFGDSAREQQLAVHGGAPSGETYAFVYTALDLSTTNVERAVWVPEAEAGVFAQDGETTVERVRVSVSAEDLASPERYATVTRAGVAWKIEDIQEAAGGMIEFTVIRIAPEELSRANYRIHR